MTPKLLLAAPVARSSIDQGQVIGINFAMVRDFGGSNFAIPVRFGESLLRP
jgi:S1-C subfamily serine protease